MTPWLPIAVALAAMFLVGYAVARITHDATIGVSSAILVLGIALLLLGTIATAMFIPGGALVLFSIVGILFRVFVKGPADPR